MKTKILLFTNKYEDFVNSRKDFVYFLINNNVVCDAFCPKKADQKTEHSFRLFTYNYLKSYLIIFYIPKVLLKLREINKNKYDIIYSIKIFPNLITALYKLFFKKNQKIIALIAGRGIFQHIHENLIIHLIFKFYIQILKQFDEIIVQNNKDKIFFEKYLKRHVNLINGSGYEIKGPNKVIKNILLEKFKKLNSSKIVFTFPSRIIKMKGIVELIEAFNDKSINSNATLLISGWIDEKSLNSYFKKNINNTNIHYVGNNDIQQIMNLSDCIILPSKYGEGVPRTLIEALAHSKPIITSGIQGCEDVFNNNGFKLNQVSKKSIIKVINDFCILEDQDIINMKCNSLKLFKEKFHSDIIYKNTMKIIKKLS